MIHISNDNPTNTMTGVLLCECVKCGKKAVYKMSEEETKTCMEYQIKGRSMGALKDLFPDIPAWILTGSLDPNTINQYICPSCPK